MFFFGASVGGILSKPFLSENVRHGSREIVSERLIIFHNRSSFDEQWLVREE